MDPVLTKPLVTNEIWVDEPSTAPPGRCAAHGEKRPRGGPATVRRHVGRNAAGQAGRPIDAHPSAAFMISELKRAFEIGFL
jgi:hypothetical protein